MRYLAIDLGDKRTGLALGDDQTHVVTALPPIEAPNESLRFEAVIGQIDQQGPDALVLGLPLNMDGSEGPAAKAARRVGQQLAEQTGLAVHLVDERLTSEAADAAMAGSGMTRDQKRRRRDGLAAATILRDFLGRA